MSVNAWLWDDEMAVDRKGQGWMWWPPAIAAAVFTGWVDLRLEELLLTALLILSFSMAFGLAHPVRPWRWGLLFGLAIPAAHLVARTTGWMWVDPERLLGAFLAVLPAVVGASAGWFFRLTIARVLEEERARSRQ